jgi:hypothetical protein
MACVRNFNNWTGCRKYTVEPHRGIQLLGAFMATTFADKKVINIFFN